MITLRPITGLGGGSGRGKAEKVKAPLVKECYVNFMEKVIDKHLLSVAIFQMNG